MRRIPVIISASAKEVIDKSTRQGRVFPQALSEFFGTLPDVEQVEVDLEEPGDRLMIHVKHCEDEDKHHCFHIEADAITQASQLAGVGFDAAAMADELHRLYRAHVLREEGQ